MRPTETLFSVHATVIKSRTADRHSTPEPAEPVWPAGPPENNKNAIELCYEGVTFRNPAGDLQTRADRSLSPTCWNRPGRGDTGRKFSGTAVIVAAGAIAITNQANSATANRTAQLAGQLAGQASQAKPTD